MAYKKQEWENGKDGNTPITADRLNHIENGINDAAKKADNADKKAGSKADKSALDDKADADKVSDLEKRIESLENNDSGSEE